ncbi:MAG: DUF4405 domain-containing protein [Candidatus Aminicenantales bacterium]
MRIKESDWRYLVDTLLFICLIGMVFIGILLGFVLQEGPVSAGGSKYFLGLHRHQWGDIHAYLSIAFVVLMAVHLTLSWKWIKAKTRQIFKGQTTAALVAIGVLPFVVLLFFWMRTPKDAETFRSYGAGAGEIQRILPIQPREAPSPAENEVPREDLRIPETPGAPAVEPERRRDEEHHAQVGSITVTGQHTLRDLERGTGIPAREIARRMGLPEWTPVNETLGRLRRRYGFEIDQVRDVVSRLLEEKGARRD